MFNVIDPLMLFIFYDIVLDFLVSVFIALILLIC